MAMDAGADGSKDAEKVFLSMEAMQSNGRGIGSVRTLMSIVAGVLTGILGCTSFEGAVAFVATHLATTLGILLVMGFDSAKFTNLSLSRFLLDGVTTNAGSFLLFWTLFYALIYLY
eukprot:scaffold2036_cov256-Pinguiococcus_pyrenoidosus.AAC.13